MTRLLRICCFFLSSLVAITASADSRRVIEYGYDGAGNVISIDSSLSTNPPVINNLAPNAIRIGKTITVVATGTDLKNAQISSDDPENLIVAGVSTTETEVSFQLTALDGAAISMHDLTFATSLGSTVVQMDVQPRAPVLRVAPIPLILSNTGTPRTLDIRLSGPDIFDNTITLIVENPGIVSASTASAFIPAGQTTPTQPVTLSGLTEGSTRVSINSTTLQNFDLTATVSADFVQPPEGTQVHAYAAQLGVELTPLVVTPDLAERGPIVAQLQVVKETDPVADVNNRTVVTQPLSLVIGSVFESLSPSSIRADTGPVSLVISGQGLDSVDQVTVSPADGVTLGALSVSGDGQQVTVPVTVDSGVVLSERRVSLSVSGTEIKPAQPRAGQVFIGGELPEIDSISPVVTSRLANSTLCIVGRNFEGVQRVKITPAEDIQLSNQPTINTDNTEVCVSIGVDEFALLGPRVVSVVSVTGESSLVASAANTLTIANGLDGQVTPISSAALGVLFNDTPAQVTTDRLISTKPLNVVLGASITGLTPQQQAVDSSFTLAINGTDLGAVTDVGFSPDDGVTLSAPVVAGDGQSLTVDVTIAADAPATLRQVLVTASGSPIRPASPEADRFRITPPQPSIASIAPNYLVAGAGTAAITIRGQLFDEVQSVRLIPADDITVNTPTVNAAGDIVTVELTALAGAQTGPRTLVVKTPGGETTLTPDAANTMNVVSQVVATRTPILSAPLGIQKDTDTPPPAATADRLILASPIGVELQASVPDPTRDIEVVGALTGVTLGPIGLGLTPSAALIDSSMVVTINGSELDDVTAVAFVPADGVTLTSGFTVNSAGTQITVPIDVDVNAPQTLRQVVLTTASGEVRFSSPEGDRIRIAGDAAIIDSIEPIQQVPGTTFDLLIRGSNFNETSVVSAAPANGVQFNTPVVNGDGTEITVRMVIDLTATPGPRAITVTTPSGTTSDTPTAENTFTVVLE